NNGASNEGNNNGNNEAEGDVEGAEDGVIQIFEDSEIPTMDSSHAHDSIGFNTLNNTNEGLYRGDDNHEPQPALAEDVEVSDDATVYTFMRREDADWCNGRPVTAQYFEYAWKRTFEEVGHYADMFVTASVENAQEILDEEKDPDELGVEAVDDHTLVVTLENSNKLLEQLLNFPKFFHFNEDFVYELG